MITFIHNIFYYLEQVLIISGSNETGSHSEEKNKKISSFENFSPESVNVRGEVILQKNFASKSPAP